MEEKNQDLCLIQGMAQELGISPLEIFMYWVETGRVKNLALKVTYDNGEVAELDLAQIGFSTNFAPPKISFPNPATHQKEEVESPELPFEEGQPKPEAPVAPPPPAETSVPATQEAPAESEKVAEDDNSADTKPEREKDLCTTSIKHGRIHVKEGQTNNVKVGAYVYTTGDILPTSKTLEHVNVRGIVLSYSKERITIIKYIGSNMTAVQSSAQVGQGWRFLTFKESGKIAKYKETLNVSLQGVRRKQVDNDSMLLYQDEDNELYAYGVASGKVHKSLNNKFVVQERGFAVFLAKDLKVV